MAWNIIKQESGRQPKLLRMQWRGYANHPSRGSVQNGMVQYSPVTARADNCKVSITIKSRQSRQQQEKEMKNANAGESSWGVGPGMYRVAFMASTFQINV